MSADDLERATFEYVTASGANACYDCQRTELPHHENCSIGRILAALREERERCAKIADLEAERIKHTSHKDGLGMGDQRSEQVALEIAAAIRKGEE